MKFGVVLCSVIFFVIKSVENVSIVDPNNGSLHIGGMTSTIFDHIHVIIIIGLSRNLRRYPDSITQSTDLMSFSLHRQFSWWNKQTAFQQIMLGVFLLTISTLLAASCIGKLDRSMKSDKKGNFLRIGDRIHVSKIDHDQSSQPPLISV